MSMLNPVPEKTSEFRQAGLRNGAAGPSTVPILGRPGAATFLLAVFVLAGMGIRAYRLTDRSIWFDEASSWRTSQLPFSEMLDSVAHNDHLPLYYILLKSWISVFGDSLWAMRGLSVLLAGATMVGVYLFAVETFRPDDQQGPPSSSRVARWIGLFAAALIALSVLQIRAAWETRMYTLGTALVAFSSWTLFRALRAPAVSWKRWTVHGAVILLLAYTHNFALFSIGGQVLFLVGLFVVRGRARLAQILQDRQFRASVVTYTAVAICWAPWLPILLRQTRQVREEWWSSPLGASDVLNRCYEMFFGGSADYSSAIIAATICIALLIALVWRGGIGAWYAFCLGVVPFLMGVAGSLELGRSILILRYLVFAHLFLLVGLAALIGRICDRWARNTVALIVIANVAAVYMNYRSQLDISSKPGMKAAVAFIEANGHPREPVIVCSPLLYFPATYYFKDRARCHVFSDGSPFVHHRGGPFTEKDDLILADQIDKLGPGRVWVICGGWSPVDIPIPARWQFVQRKEFDEVFDFQQQVDIELYEIPVEQHTGRDAQLNAFGTYATTE